MNITIKQLKAFVALAQSRSFAEASDKLNLSQPALSITIKNLEQTLGGSLMTRSTRSLALTPEGEAFLPVVKRMLNDWDNAFNDVSNMFLLKRGKLNIAAMPFISASLLPKVLSKYNKNHPQISVSLHDVINEDVIDSVRSGRAELGICFRPGKNDDLEFIELFDEDFIAITHKDNPLAKQSDVTWRDLFKHPFITLQAPASIREDIRTTMENHEIPYSVHIETHQLATVGEMVAAGLGVSAVPKSSSKQMTEMGCICLALLNPVVIRKVGIIYRRRYQLSVAATAMKEMVINHNR